MHSKQAKTLLYEHKHNDFTIDPSTITGIESTTPYERSLRILCTPNLSPYRFAKKCTPSPKVGGSLTSRCAAGALQSTSLFDLLCLSMPRSRIAAWGSFQACALALRALNGGSPRLRKGLPFIGGNLNSLTSVRHAR